MLNLDLHAPPRWQKLQFLVLFFIIRSFFRANQTFFAASVFKHWFKLQLLPAGKLFYNIEDMQIDWFSIVPDTNATVRAANGFRSAFFCVYGDLHDGMPIEHGKLSNDILSINHAANNLTDSIFCTKPL